MGAKHILIILLIFLVCISSANAFITFKTNSFVKISGYEIMLTGVTEDKSCIFRINNKTLSVPEHEEGTKEGVYIWVKDAYKTHSKDKDYCIVILSLPSSLLTNSSIKKDNYTKSTPIITTKQNTTNKTNYSVETLSEQKEIEPTISSIMPSLQNTQKQEEKGFLEKIAEWFRRLFG